MDLNKKQRNRAAKRHNLTPDGTPKPKPCWAEAIMILLLYKTAKLQEEIDGTPVRAQLTVSLADLERFEKLAGEKNTLMSYDPDEETVTIRAPEVKLPERIVTAKSKIITGTN